MTSRITFKPPGRDEPGYLRRTRKALAFAQAMKDNPTPEAIDDLVDFLVDYVTEPADRMQAKSALWDASEQQFQDLLRRVQGGNQPPLSGKPSEPE